MASIRKVSLFWIITILLIASVAVSYSCANTVRDSMKLYDKGKREYRRGDYVDAIGYLKKAAYECPESDMTQVSMYFLGKSYQMAGKNDQAIETYNELVDKYQSGQWVAWAKNDLKSIK